jgi:hypothetical protein
MALMERSQLANRSFVLDRNAVGWPGIFADMKKT